jgi:hypothetical protein
MTPSFGTPVRPLQFSVMPCPTCGRIVLMRVWNKGNWAALPDVQEPVTGGQHVCAVPSASDDAAGDEEASDEATI